LEKNGDIREIDGTEAASSINCSLPRLVVVTICDLPWIGKECGLNMMGVLVNQFVSAQEPDGACGF